MDPMPWIFTIFTETGMTKKIVNANIRTKYFLLFISYFLKKIILLAFISHSTLLTLQRQWHLNSSCLPRQKTLFLTAVMSMHNTEADSLWRLKGHSMPWGWHWRDNKIFTTTTNNCPLELILHILDKQVTPIACVSRHSTCATACWHHSGNCVVPMTKQRTIATSYCSACNRPWRSSLSCASVPSAIAGLLESDTSSSGGQIHEKDSHWFPLLLVLVPEQYPFYKYSNWLAKIIEMCNFKLQL